MQQYVGLDAHSKNSVFVMQNEEGRILGQGRVPTSAGGFREMRDLHQLTPGTPVALESGPVAFLVVDYLTELGLRPVVIDAGTICAHSTRGFSAKCLM